MITTFFNHELKSFWRSKNTGKSVAIKVVMGVLILILLLYVLAFGVFLDIILKKMFPAENLTVTFCGIILVYFLSDLLMRMQLQELPTLKVQPYLHLPVKRNSVVGYLALTSLLSFFNLWPIILFGPFILKVIVSAAGGGVAAVFMIAIIALAIFNNYLALYIKRKANLNGWIFLMAGGILALITCGDYLWHLYSFKSLSYLFFGNLILKPYLVALPLILAAGMFYINFYYLKGNLYLEELSSKKEAAKSSTEIPFLGRFGQVGDLVANEVKLILRNKRPRSALIMGLFFMFYGLIFYTNPKMGEGFKVFVGMFMTGIFIINYGQFMFSWQASHFDGILVSKVKFTDFLKAKYLLFTIVSTVAFILTTPYVYFGWRTVLIHFVMYLWNLGINTTIVLYFANRNYKRIDLSKGASFNWEGVGASQLLLSFPLILLPYLIYLPFKFLGYTDAGLAVLAVTGVVFIITRDFWIKKLEGDFYNKRYQIAEGFRNK
ncbi:DUF5687 family protein [Mucilaginibacter phyllosphaerae]|uniref:ABC transporter permease n=1 Tax=Mucilaginibacter phyllosphaerae TaxID=1812349 RepID=A0A4Y8A6D3_9SPHI|nr:DUF5687 family protein [Mucilaginibacter phyllosphaerae]MBB3971164.1 hypothetical protein [Mucilaginibacter phyllosphaerae]TEW63889.1 hypothetical protein E2R65_19215 [Mucilaginibacter phyllosphaerae]GGH22849.1 hypothetical protein GCM10007352_36420 [Mucilaginibacter phyllosphaerae]